MARRTVAVLLRRATIDRPAFGWLIDRKTMKAILTSIPFICVAIVQASSSSRKCYIALVPLDSTDVSRDSLSIRPHCPTCSNRYFHDSSSHSTAIRHRSTLTRALNSRSQWSRRRLALLFADTAPHRPPQKFPEAQHHARQHHDTRNSTTATMAKKALAKDQIVKLIVGAGQASPSPPVGPALGSKGVKSMDFCKVRYDAERSCALEERLGRFWCASRCAIA